MNKRVINSIITLCIAFGLTGTSPAEAALGTFIPSVNTPTLVVSPQIVSPQSSAVVTLANAADMTGITWSIDGKLATSSVNARSINVQLGKAGVTTSVTAKLSDGTTLQKSITPSSADLIVEPLSHIPDRYEGRALPSAGSTFRAVAIPELYRSGKRVSADSLIYTWEVNGRIVGNGPQKGMRSITESMPVFGNGTIVLTVRTEDGAAVARASSGLRAIKPFVLFTEENTLYGNRIYSPKTFIIPREETTIHAVPYYLNESALQNGSFDYTWTVGGRKVASPNGDPRTITLGKGVGETQVRFDYRSNDGALEYGSGSFNISFTDSDPLSL